MAILKEWLFVTVLPTLQNVADSNGFGNEWATMCAEKTSDAAYAAYAAARAAYAAYAAAAAAAAYAAYVDYVADAADATRAANVADAAAHATNVAGWQSFDVCGTLQKLIEVTK